VLVRACCARRRARRGRQMGRIGGWIVGCRVVEGGVGSSSWPCWPGSWGGVAVAGGQGRWIGYEWGKKEMEVMER